MKLKKGCEKWALASLKDSLDNDERYSYLSNKEKKEIFNQEKKRLIK